MSLHEPADRLPLPKVIGLRETQENFLRYQRAGFPERSSQFFALELCGECGELANMEKKAWRHPAAAPPPEDMAAEAADVLIALLNYCNAKSIDLESAICLKLEKIETKRLSGAMGAVR